MAHPIKKKKFLDSRLKTSKQPITDGVGTIEKEELETLQKLNSDLVSNMNKVAVASLEKMSVEEQLFSLREENQEIKKKMENLLTELGNKYNMASVDLETGSFKVRENVEEGVL